MPIVPNDFISQCVFVPEVKVFLFGLFEQTGDMPLRNAEIPWNLRPGVSFLFHRAEAFSAPRPSKQSNGAVICRPAACSVPSIARFKHAGNPLLVFESNYKKIERWVLPTYHEYVIIMLYNERSDSLYGKRAEDQSRQTQTAYKPNGVCAAFRRVLCNGQSLREWEDGAFYDDVPSFAGWGGGVFMHFQEYARFVFGKDVDS